jgi:hypothetical protein
VHATLGDFLLDLVQNAVEAGAAAIDVRIEQQGTRVRMDVADDGCGMDAETLAKARDPFHTAPGKHRRKVGLGLAFLQQAAEQTGGSLQIESTPGRGTHVRVELDQAHWDTPPEGGWASTLLSCLTLAAGRELRGVRRRDGRAYAFSRTELEEAAGPLDRALSLARVKQYLESQESDLYEAGA